MKLKAFYYFHPYYSRQVTRSTGNSVSIRVESGPGICKNICFQFNRGDLGDIFAVSAVFSDEKKLRPCKARSDAAFPKVFLDNENILCNYLVYEEICGV